MKNNPYIHAVENMARLVEKFKSQLHPEDVTNLKFGLFLLRMQPQYSGLEPRKENNES